MSEKRKPTIKLLLTFQGNKNESHKYKVELFPARLWPESNYGDLRQVELARPTSMDFDSRYRVRVNGRWLGTHKDKKRFMTYTLTEIKNMLFRGFYKHVKNPRRAARLEKLTNY